MNSARELSIMVLANSPESGRILSMRMSRFSGYSSGASTTGQRSWGKSEIQHTIKQMWHSNTEKQCMNRICTISIPSDKCIVNFRQEKKCVDHRFPIPRQSVLRKASICSWPTPLAPFWPNSRWESSNCKTSMAISWKPPSWFPPRSASTYDRRRSGSFCLMNCAAEKH